jgi:hypothetical protein
MMGKLKLNNKFFICECFNEGLLASYYPEDVNDLNGSFAIFTYGQYNAKDNFFGRLKYAWNYLVTGKMNEDQFILNPDKMQDLVDYLNKIIENGKSKQSIKELKSYIENYK